MFKYSAFEHQQEKCSLGGGGIWLPEVYRGSALVFNSGVRNVAVEIGTSWITDLCQNMRVKLV